MDQLFDPLYNQQAPRRYALESDSEDSEFEGEQPKPKKAVKQEIVTLDGQNLACKTLYVAIGDAGEVWSGGCKGKDVGRVMVNEQVEVGNVVQVNADTMLLQGDSALSLSALYPFVEAVLGACKPSSVHIIDSYSVDNYLGSSPANPPIRCLATPDYPSLSSSLAKFDIPNLHPGLAAAFLIESDRSSIPCCLLLLPSAATNIGLGHTRPDTIYDPTPDTADQVLLNALRHVDASALGWAGIWDKAVVPGNGWLWLKKARKEKEAKRKEDSGIENMYM